jgi:hypothetical protein
MFNYLGKFKHLRAEEFINLLDGISLSEERAGHLSTCSDCRTTLTSITELRHDVSDSQRMDVEAADVAVANADWLELRSSVRDRLLARSVKHSSALQRWTGWTLRPAAAWSIALIILVTGMTAGGLWHHQTAHLTNRTNDPADVSLTDGLDLSLPDSGLEFGLFADDAQAVEAEALAWSRTEIFTTLNELEVGEEEVLRELIALAFAEDSMFDAPVQ